MSIDDMLASSDTKKQTPDQNTANVQEEELVVSKISIGADPSLLTDTDEVMSMQ